MAKTIWFPLEMKDGAKANTLVELKEHWDVEKIVGHFSSGKLMTWLRDRPYENERAQVEELEEKDSEELRQKLSAIFGMEYETGEKAAEDLETVRDRQARLTRLRQATTDKEILDDVDHVAFNQYDLWDILSEGVKKVYLVNNTFEIPLANKDVTYVGVGKAVAKIDSEEPVDFDALGIRFENVQFDEDYARIESESFCDDEKPSAHYQSHADYSSDASCTVFKASLKMMDDEEEKEKEDEDEEAEEEEGNLDDGRILTLTFRKEKLKGIVLSEDDNSLYLFKLNTPIALDIGDIFALFDEEDEIASGVVIDVYDETTLEKAGIYNYIRVRSDETGVRDFVNIKGLGCSVIISWKNREFEGTVLSMEKEPGFFYPSFEYVIELHEVVVLEEGDLLDIRPEDSPRGFEECEVKELISKDELQKRMNENENDDNEEDEDE